MKLDILQPQSPLRPVEPDLTIEDVRAILWDTDTDDEVAETIEHELMDLHQLLKLAKFSTEQLNDPALLMLLGTESLSAKQISSAMWSGLKKVGRDLVNFANWTQATVKTKLVTETYINKRFTKLEATIADITLAKALVNQVPKFETMQHRQVGLRTACDYLASLGDQAELTLDDTLLDKLALMSKGAVTAIESSGGSTYKNLVWTTPEVMDYDLLRSGWALPVNTHQLQNLIIDTKFNGLIALGRGATKLSKQCQRLTETYPPETDDLTQAEYNQFVNSYSNAFLTTKAVKQLYRAITKEINYLTINVISKLIHYQR